MIAAHSGVEIALRMVKAGATNSTVTAALKRVAEAYGVNLLQGVLSHQMKQHVIDGDKVILLREEHDQKVDEVVFEAGDVFSLDVAVSTGEGKPKEAADARTTVYRRSLDTKYSLKSSIARELFASVSKRAPVMPFTLRALVPELEKGEVAARAGVTEPSSHGLLLGYPVLFEKEGAVAHFQITALLVANGTAKITGLGPLPSYIKSDKVLPEDLAALLETEAHTSKKAKRAAKAAGAGGDVVMA